VWEELSKRRVYPVSPNTLAITLKGIAIASEYYEMAKGVEKTIEEIRKAQKHFGGFERQFEEIGEKLEKAEKAFNTAQTHLGRYQSSVVRLTGEQPLALPEPDGDRKALPEAQ
jgi:DNA anti-recombination protein RmuC